MFTFIRESYAEFKKVVWPTKEETKRLTAYVIGISVLIGIFVSGLDFTFRELLNIYIR